MQEEFRDFERDAVIISETIQETETKDDVIADKEVKNTKETGKKEGKKQNTIVFNMPVHSCQ